MKTTGKWNLSICLCLAGALLCAMLMLNSNAFASDPVQQTGETTDSEMSAAEWRDRISKAKARAQQLRAAAKAGLQQYNRPNRAELDRIADERVMQDLSLRSGDVVSTSKGLFTFAGEAPDGNRIFTPLPRTDPER